MAVDYEQTALCKTLVAGGMPVGRAVDTVLELHKRLGKHFDDAATQVYLDHIRHQDQGHALTATDEPPASN